MTDALVLSGGEIKGAYQAGVIFGLTEAGYKPDIVTGISVGALATAWLAAFPNDGLGLAQFWLTRVTSPHALVKKRGLIDLALRVLTKRWDGVIDTDPLKALIREKLGPHFPATAGPIAKVGAVNLISGAIEYVGSDSPDFIDAVIASASEPIIMPLQRIGQSNDWYCDGGLRDIAPLKQAITLGATRITVVLCQAKGMARADGLPAGDLLNVVSRSVGIGTNEILENDIARAEEVNTAVAMLKRLQVVDTKLHDGEGSVPRGVAKLHWKREIEIRVIRPASGFAVDVGSFTAGDIHRMVDQGYVDGRAAGLP